MLPLRAIARPIGRVAIPAVISLIAYFASSVARAGEPYEPLGAPTSAPPSGWLQFCDTYSTICDTKSLPPLDVVVDNDAWSNLRRINLWVNHNINPETDMDHYGMIQWWRYPDDGAGACHSYALLKRRILLQAGWPRQALLMTIVHESDGEGHAILTVATDRGDYILDNLTDKILPWSQTPYSYYMRQSQSDPNAWVWIKDDHAAFPTSSVRAPSARCSTRASASAAAGTMNGISSSWRAALPAPAACRSTLPDCWPEHPIAARRSRLDCTPSRVRPRGRSHP